MALSLQFTTAPSSWKCKLGAPKPARSRQITALLQSYPHRRSDAQQNYSAWLKTAAKTGISLAAALLITTAPSALAKEEIFGPAKVVDGDTLVFNDTRIRLFGIDAPETKQSCSKSGNEYACGTAAQKALQSKIGNSTVRCAVKNKDMYGRSVAVCRLNDGKEEDLNAWMVSEGWAVSYKRYSQAYVPLEAIAQQQKKGIWAGTFEQPDQWRKEHPRGGRSSSNSGLNEKAAAAAVMATAAPVPAAMPVPVAIKPDCLIKGNISAKGEKVYHVPGGKFYDSTRIEEKKGEKWFCSIEQAEAAGWRAAKG